MGAFTYHLKQKEPQADQPRFLNNHKIKQVRQVAKAICLRSLLSILIIVCIEIVISLNFSISFDKLLVCQKWQTVSTTILAFVKLKYPIRNAPVTGLKDFYPLYGPQVALLKEMTCTTTHHLLINP